MGSDEPNSCGRRPHIFLGSTRLMATERTPTPAMSAPLSSGPTIRTNLKPELRLRIWDEWRRRGLATFLRAEGFVLDSRTPEVVLAEAPSEVEDIRPDLKRLQAEWPDAVLIPPITARRWSSSTEHDLYMCRQTLA